MVFTRRGVIDFLKNTVVPGFRALCPWTPLIALNPGSALNPRTLNPGTTVSFHLVQDGNLS